jgi:hypothetical protein
MSRIFVTALSALCLFVSCAEDSVLRFNWNGSSKFPLEETARSKEPIDNFPANELFFTMSAPENAMSITIKGDAASGLITGERREIPLYMVIEREIRSSAGRSFVEIGRNFTRSWEQKSSVIIRTDNNIPFAQLNPGIFRIRFTSFRKETYNVNIRAEATHPVVFSAEKPAAPVVPPEAK